MTAKNANDLSNLNFEQAMSQLEEIVSTLESGEAGLDEAMEIYSQGQKLKELCSAKLAKARLQVEKINSDKSGDISISAFNAQG
jgi:exodeoxyribonuclease VII small subunit